MKNQQAIALRAEYAALVLVADGLIEMLREACNPITIARMAQEARDAARKIASMIERLIIEERPAPEKRKASVWEKVVAVVKSAVAAALAR